MRPLRQQAALLPLRPRVKSVAGRPKLIRKRKPGPAIPETLRRPHWLRWSSRLSAPAPLPPDVKCQMASRTRELRNMKWIQAAPPRRRQHIHPRRPLKRSLSRSRRGRGRHRSVGRSHRNRDHRRCRSTGTFLTHKLSTYHHSLCRSQIPLSTRPRDTRYYIAPSP